MQHQRSPNTLVIAAILLVGLATPAFGQDIPPQDTHPTTLETAVLPSWADPFHPLPTATPDPPPPATLIAASTAQQTESFPATAEASSGKVETTSAVLWEQPVDNSTNVASQCFPNFGSCIYSADDFANDDPWVVDTIFVDGGFWNYPAATPTLNNAQDLNWYIYPDAGGVPGGIPGDGKELWSHTALPADPKVIIGSSDGTQVTLDLTSSPLVLPPATYWLFFFPTLVFGDWGQFGWNPSTISNLTTAHLIDPDNLIGNGWTSWTPWPEVDASACDAAFRLEGSPLEWEKRIDKHNWTPGISVTVETSDTLQVTDVITPILPFDLVDRWQPRTLTLLDYEIEPFDAGTVITSTGWLTWTVSSGVAITLTKWFHVEPCTWRETVLTEELWVEGLLARTKLISITKLSPELWIDSLYEAEVTAGQPLTFKLRYGNNGAYENDVSIRSTFPVTAPFVSSVPPADRKDPAGLWAEWDTGDLTRGQESNIEVTVAIADTLEPASINIRGYINDHIDEQRDLAEITFYWQPLYLYLPLFRYIN